MRQSAAVEANEGDVEARAPQRAVDRARTRFTPRVGWPDAIEEGARPRAEGFPRFVEGLALVAALADRRRHGERVPPAAIDSRAPGASMASEATPFELGM